MARKKKDEPETPAVAAPPEQPELDIEKIGTEIRDLPCSLTPDQVIARARRTADLVRQLAEVQSSAKATAAGYKADEKRINAEISVLAQQVREGVEVRKVECSRWANFSENSFVVLRNDTHVKVEERAMMEHERQRQMQLRLGDSEEPGHAAQALAEKQAEEADPDDEHEDPEDDGDDDLDEERVEG